MNQGASGRSLLSNLRQETPDFDSCPLYISLTHRSWG